MRKIRKLLLFIGLMMTIINCSNKNNTHFNKSDLNKNIAKNNVITGNDYLKNITYSNLADEKTQNEVQEILKNSGISSQNINLFFQSVNYYNKKTENTDLIKSNFVNSQNINPTYDEAKIQKLWDKNSSNFVGFNCRITAFTLMKDFITTKNSLAKSGEMLFMDMESLKNLPFKLFSETEKDKFVNLFSEIPTKATKDVKIHVENVKNVWKERGVKFDKNSKVSMISVFFHFNDDPEENILFIGHVGILVPEDNGKLLFIEKLAFQQPYQVLKFNNRTELNDYLMNKYDTAWGQPVAKPFIMENDELLKGYRNNPNNNK
ncbi:membrane associated protein [Leptotrichia trevisanii]|uniref:Membrane associated protein n=1 Tax=Leptotrichia trevisanii TaxID=109328 RepID=A0A510KKG5_9FUSO|nr:DUF4300 family protein [Leptotrichia trevisanii]BBM52134.1 membrane associated protein [Leptotrichia trevisanii]